MRTTAHVHDIEGLGVLRHAHQGGDQPHAYTEHERTGELREQAGSGGLKRISTRADLTALASELGVRPDWHEPDERGVTALVSGHVLDNAGFWGVGGTGSIPSAYQELWVTIMVKENEGVEPRAVAEVNLAMLLAWSTGYVDR